MIKPKFITISNEEIDIQVQKGAGAYGAIGAIEILYDQKFEEWCERVNVMLVENESTKDIAKVLNETP